MSESAAPSSIPSRAATAADAPWTRGAVVAHTALLLDSFAHWLGRSLIERSGDAARDARALFEAPLVIVSHGTEADPVLNYGNRAALDLWEMDFDALCATPSRLTAEPGHRDERARMLEEAERQGYFAGYSGVRVSRSGMRFRIEDALIWRLRRDDGSHAGQAATFSRWRTL